MIATAATLSPFAQAFVRENGHCIYCKRDLMESLDAFAGAHLDHLKPRSAQGALNEPMNEVIACFACNSIKGSFDPIPDGKVTAENFEAVVAVARDYINKKRAGAISCSYRADFDEWKERLPRMKSLSRTP